MSLIADAAAVTVGVDLGGTGTRVVALDERGAVIGKQVFATPRTRNDSAIQRVLEAVTDVAADRPLTAVGIGASGPVTAAGIIDNAATLPAFTGIDLCDRVSTHVGRPCVIDNDAATAAIGEYTYGAGQGSRTPLTVTLGTGIGVAVIADARVIRAGDGTHPEAGHIAVRDAPTRCYCGLPRCWEQAASRTALEGLVGGDTTVAAEAARAGDIRAAAAFEHYGQNVASGLATLLTIYRPDRVIVGGSAAQYLDLFTTSLTNALQRPPEYNWGPSLAPAQLGDLAGAIGAAVLARTADHALNSPRGRTVN